jgi:hypothetical protein
VYVPNKSSEYPQLEFWRGTGLDKRGSWSIGQYIKTIELYINLDRITVLQDPTNFFRRRLFTLFKGLLEVMHRLTATFQLKKEISLTPLLYLQKLKS